MKMFLLKQIERLTTKAAVKVPVKFLKPSHYMSSIVAVAAMVITPVYAGEKLNDAELDTKFIDVQIRQICIVDHQASKAKDDQKSEIKATKYSCNTDNLFVTTIDKDEAEKKSRQVGSSSDLANSDDETDSNALLSGVFQNMRSFGRSDLLGVSVGVSNSGIPILFGSERYSYKWAGNLSDIFQPIYTGGVMAPYSVYDYSSLGYGFREEAHIPYNIPPPTIHVTNGN